MQTRSISVKYYSKSKQKKVEGDDDKLYLTMLTLSAEAGFHNGSVKNINKLLQVK